MEHKVIAGFLGALLVSACSQMATDPTAGGDEYGVPQSAQECIAAVENKLVFAVRNPSDLRWRHGGACYRGSWPPIEGQPTLYGYLQDGEFETVESLRDYAGFKRYKALIRNGRVIRYCIMDDGGACDPRS